MKKITVASQISAETHEPFVVLHMEGQGVQLQPTIARQLAALLLAAAEGAESEANVLKTALEITGNDVKAAVAFLQHYRKVSMETDQLRTLLGDSVLGA